MPLLGSHELLHLGKIESRGETVRKFSPEACVHLAWAGLPDYSLARCMENFNLGVELIKELSDTGCQKIFVAGTCWEYGDLQGQVRESDPTRVTNLFASFKTSLRLVAESLMAPRKQDLIWGRLFFIYGPGQRKTSLIPSCYNALSHDQPFSVNTPNAVSDFIHVSDAARAIKTLIESTGVSGIFNIGSGVPATAAEVCQLVSRCLNKNGSVPDGVTAEKRGMWADVSLIKARTGWTPQLSLEAGIQQTVAGWKGDARS